MTSPYSTAKIAHHPAVLEKLRRGDPTVPILVQWFPSHQCQQACSFCSFSSGPPSIRAKVPNPARALWKNQQTYDPKLEMPREKMLETVACLRDMGVKAVEISGGGDPLLYSHFNEMVTAIQETGMELALVSNGVALDVDTVTLLASVPFIWARISIDAGSVEDYIATRHCPRSHWVAAWTAVEWLSKAKRHPEARVGVGFVVDRENWKGVYDCARKAKEHGADNIRISMSFTPEHTGRWAEVLPTVREQAARAKAELEDVTFQVNDLTAERAENEDHGRQLYPYCYWKSIGCVIGADCLIYSCCSLAFNRAGLMGSIVDKTFTEMWKGEGAAWRAVHDPRRDCRVTCLYESRNQTALKLMVDRAAEAVERAQGEPPHKNFI